MADDTDSAVEITDVIELANAGADIETHLQLMVNDVEAGLLEEAEGELKHVDELLVSIRNYITNKKETSNG